MSFDKRTNSSSIVTGEKIEKISQNASRLNRCGNRNLWRFTTACTFLQGSTHMELRVKRTSVMEI